MWVLNRTKFREVFPPGRIITFWRRAIEDMEDWFVNHPLFDAICAASDLSLYLPIHIFGDDACLKKSRAIGTITWCPGVWTPLTALQSRIPFYVVARHLLVANHTENELQKVLVWAMTVWQSGKFPSADHLGNCWPDRSVRQALCQEHSGTIAGGHCGVYVGQVADQLWLAQHYRLAQSWSTGDCCHRCFAGHARGPANFANGIYGCRSTSSYQRSPGGLRSPLSQLPGQHLSLLRGEAMHAGCLGSIPDVVASCIVEMAGCGLFGFSELTTWENRLQAQLNVAYEQFSIWAKSNDQVHRIRRFHRMGFDMKTLTSWPFFKSKAHDALVVVRWLAHATEIAMSGASDVDYARTRWHVCCAWADWFSVCLTSDPDFLRPSELKRLDQACQMLFFGHRKLAAKNSLDSRSRFEFRVKLHVMLLITADALASRRNPRAWWSFKDEEFMGRLSKIAGATHAISLSNRTLTRWCTQFLGGLDDEEKSKQKPNPISINHRLSLITSNRSHVIYTKPRNSNSSTSSCSSAGVIGVDSPA